MGLLSQSLATAAALVVLAASAHAQSRTTTVDGRPTTASSSAAAATHTIKVGFPVGQHAFSPKSTTANVGDSIAFEMYPSNHSVVHMDPNSPCVPNDVAGDLTSEPWWSHFFHIESARNPGRYDIVVNTTDPIWFYCSAPDSCIVYEMVGVININESKNSLASVQKRASQAQFMLSPGEPVPAEGTQTAAPPAASTKAGSDDDDSNNSSSNSSSLSAGAIAGIVIGAIGAFGLVGLLFFLVGRRKKAAEVKEKAAADAEAAANAHPPPPPQSPPMYQDGDARYSMVPGSPPPHDNYYAGKPGHASLVPDRNSGVGAASFQERDPHRLSELPSQSYEPVELFTPDPEHPRSPANDRH